MGWTDERVEILKNLWAKGLTASQIALELGEGVTRNAVIGKVHRLKLAPRAKSTSTQTRTRTTIRPTRKSTTIRSTTNIAYSAPKRRSLSAKIPAGAPALKSSPQSENELKIARNEAYELHIPPDERVSLLELTEDKCKWPIGDPLHADFYFCGRKSLEAKPYCEFHSKRAYHRIEKKKK